MDFVPALFIVVLIKKVLDWVRAVVPDRYEAKVLIPVSWLVGVGVAFLFSLSDDLAGGIAVWSDVTLATADGATVAVYGLALGSGAGVVHDAVKPHTPPHDGA